MPLKAVSPQAVAPVFYCVLISIFDTPLTITIDHGTQFKSTLLSIFPRLTGINIIQFVTLKSGHSVVLPSHRQRQLGRGGQEKVRARLSPSSLFPYNQLTPETPVNLAEQLLRAFFSFLYSSVRITSPRPFVRCAILQNQKQFLRRLSVSTIHQCTDEFP